MWSISPILSYMISAAASLLFDAAHISEGIIVEKSPKERFSKTLDEKDRKLSGDE